MPSSIVAILIGAVAGTHAATWGMYKDSVHEGFAWSKYLRSIIVGAVAGLGLERTLDSDLSSAAGWVVFFGMVYAVERLTCELWKGYIREEDQSKYHIPMRFGILGEPVQSRVVRWTVLAGVLAALAAFAWGVVELQRIHPHLPPWLVLIAVGTLGGWITAVGGAWKDAPVEGFETLKFFRSPLISLCWAAIAALLTDSWLEITVAGAGYSVATIETYKAFFSHGRAPGKFAGKPTPYPEMYRYRRYFVPAYVVIWLLVIATTIGAAGNAPARLLATTVYAGAETSAERSTSTAVDRFTPAANGIARSAGPSGGRAE